MRKEPEIIFSCDCGHPAYLEFVMAEEGMYVLTTDRYKSFGLWLKMWFHRHVYHCETILGKKDIARLQKFIEKNKKIVK